MAKEFSFKINGAEYKCAVEEIEAGLTEVTVNGKKYTVETEKPVAPAPKAAPKAAPAAAPKAAPAPAPAAAAAAPKAAAPAPKAAAPAAAAGAQVKSPLPGSVVKVCVNEGQDVKKGDTLLILESMKMENPILAEQDGKVAQVAVAAGQTVMQDDLLVVLA